MLPGPLDASQAQHAITPDSADVALSEGKRFREGGHLPEAIEAYSRAASLARNERDSVREARSLILLSVAQMMRFEYSSSLASSRIGLEAAGKAGDPVLMGAANGNISTVYSQLGDMESAEVAASESVRHFRQADQAKAGDLLAKALANRASIYFLQNRDKEGYRDSAEALAMASAGGNLKLQATIWEARGTALMREENIPEAQIAFNKEYAIRVKLSDLDGLAISKEHLAELELKKQTPDCQLALRLIDEAFQSPSISFKANPQYYPLHIRAKLLLQAGEKKAALDGFKAAVEAAAIWRRGALPGDLTNTQTVASLQDVYADYAQLAAQISLETKDPILRDDALTTLAENRAVSLLDQLRQARGRSLQLPNSYYLKLSQLQSAQAKVTLGNNTKEDNLQLHRIRMEIADQENQIGINPQKLGAEKERKTRRNSLKDIQATLSRDQVLLSISLGKNRSYLWAVTGDQVNLTQIPKESELTAAAQSLTTSARRGRDWQSSAATLGRALFGNLPDRILQKPEWLIVSDGPLLSGVPFCTLPDLASNKNLELISGHSLRFLPSELLLLAPKTKSTPRNFVGIGDPIYNQADSRLVRATPPDAKTVSPGTSLARLVGSDSEVRSAARESHAANTTLLMGPNATRDGLQKAIETESAALVHFAVHVVSPQDQPQQAALALSLKNGVPELLTPEAIASFRLPGSLVVLSGCSSDQGKAVPGAGLLGLSRAWLIAGASAVVVSSWPTPDDSGKFFSNFYSHFDEIKSGSIARRAALALRQTQMDMLHSAGYRSSSGFWSAFAVIAKE